MTVNPFSHGEYRAKKDIGTSIKKGDIGYCTAYLPNDSVFSLMIAGKWITFEMTASEFLELFDIVIDKRDYIK